MIAYQNHYERAKDENPNRCRHCNGVTIHAPSDVDCELAQERRARYRDGWIDLDDIWQWYEYPPPDEDWIVRLVIRAYQAEHRDLPITHKVRNNPATSNPGQTWIRSWVLYVLWEQLTATGLHEGSLIPEGWVDAQVALLYLYAQRFEHEPIPEEMRRPDTYWVWLCSTAAMFWERRWFQAWRPLP